jgi:uncharacterized membrane protein
MFLKKHPKSFFTPDEQKRIIDEIRRAEECTSGEIRIHLDRHSQGDPLEKARKVFARLGMTRTKLRNGVLIYLATDHRKFAIVGDDGIHKAVPEDFWEEVKEKMQKHFRKGEFEEGMCAGIREIGNELKTYFPVGKTDTDELPNEISESDEHGR